MQLQVRSPSGRELASIEAEPAWCVRDVLAAIPEDPKALPCRRRIFLGLVELKGRLSLAEIGTSSGATLTLVKMMPPLVGAFLVPDDAGGFDVSDGTAVVWSGKRLHTLGGHGADILSIERSPDRKWVLTASADQTAKLRCVASGRCLQTFSGHEDEVYSATFSSDGEQVVTASADSTAKIWCVASGECLQTLAGHVSEVLWAGFSPNGQDALTRSHDGTAKIWRAASGECLRTFSNHGERPDCATYSPAGEQVALGFVDGTVKIWCTASGRCLHTFPRHDDGGCVMSVQFSPDGTSLLVRHYRAAKIWCLVSGECLHALGDEPLDLNMHFWIKKAQFSPGGEHVLTVSGPSGPPFTVEAEAKIWSTATGECLHTLDNGNAEFSPNGKSVLTESVQGIAMIWSVATGKCVHTLKHSPTGRVSATFAPDSEFAATSSRDDNIVKIWCPVSGECLWTFEVDRQVYRAMFFSSS